MSNYKTVFFTLGILQIILGIFMLVPIIVQFIYGQIDSSFFLGQQLLQSFLEPYFFSPI